MALTITVTDPLASELLTEANIRKIPVEQFALEVLGWGMQTNGWPSANQRRLAIIKKQFSEGLTPAEEAELRNLQEQADRHLEEMDSQMLEDVAHMERTAAEAVHGSTE